MKPYIFIISHPPEIHKTNYKRISIMAKQKYLECGKAVSTHGVRGTLRLESYCDEPEVLAKLRRLYIKTPAGDFECMKVRAASIQKQLVLCLVRVLLAYCLFIPANVHVLCACYPQAIP